MPDTLTDNAALNAIVEELQAIVDLMKVPYDTIVGDDDFVAVSDVAPVERAADELSVGMAVTNKGDDSVIVSEDGVIVGIVEPGTTYFFKGSQGEIEAKCLTGESSEIAVATYRKTA